MLGNLHVRFGVGAGVQLHGLHHLARLPQAMLVVSHDRTFWEAVTSSVVELREGRVVLSLPQS
jgi:ABC-type histidine transport system ATPase subunit